MSTANVRTWIYLFLACLGAVVPMAAFVPWMLQHGLNLPLFGRELFANRVSSFFALDLLLSAISALVLFRTERASRRFWWLPSIVTLLVGVSAALPLWMFLREHAKPHADTPTES